MKTTIILKVEIEHTPEYAGDLDDTCAYLLGDDIGKDHGLYEYTGIEKVAVSTVIIRETT